VEDRDPIKHLQHLLDDPGKVLERISRIQSALGSINAARSEAPPGPTVARPIAKTDEGDYSTLLQAFRNIEAQIEERLRPLALQTVEAEAERLNECMRREQRALDECLARIDENLVACADRIKESQTRYVDLTALKKRLEELGASTPSLPELSTTENPGQIIVARLKTLRRQGKL
jgi:hypothetical protein